jgi:hypothetical protein
VLLHRAYAAPVQSFFLGAAVWKPGSTPREPGFALVKPPVDSYHSPAVMSDIPEKPSGPNRSRPTLSGLAKETLEDDLWELDDDIAPPPAEPKAESSEPQKAPEPGKSAPSAEDSEETPADSQSTDLIDESAAAPQETEPIEESEPTETPGPEIGDDAAKPSIDDELHPGPAASAPLSLPKLSSLLPESKQERIGLISIGVVMLGIGIWWLVGLFSDVATTRLGDDLPDLPAEGRFLEIDQASTYWRAPVTDGENRDRVRNEVVIVPVLSLELGESQQGVIRVNFRNAAGEFVGDTVNQSFANGVFTSTNSNTADFTATDGFKEISEYHSYRVGTERWTAEVLEGPSEDAPGSEFQKLFTIPLSTERR